jgi:hypothetical protein
MVINAYLRLLTVGISALVDLFLHINTLYAWQGMPPRASVSDAGVRRANDFYC